MDMDMNIEKEVVPKGYHCGFDPHETKKGALKQPLFLLCLHLYSPKIASRGHTSAHAPQSMHSPAEIE